jgi:hypothetical protein
MTRRWLDGQAIAVEFDPHGLVTSFIWQRQEHRLHHIQQRWQVDTDWWTDEGRIWRDYLAVTTTSGLLCVIFQDLLTGAWYLETLYD